MRGGVRVAAYHGGAGQRKALFRTNDVNNALTFVELVIVLNTKLFGIGGKRVHLQLAFRIVDALTAISGGDIVIDYSKGEFRSADWSVV
jgi:hypothetical protein